MPRRAVASSEAGAEEGNSPVAARLQPGSSKSQARTEDNSPTHGLLPHKGEGSPRKRGALLSHFSLSILLEFLHPSSNTMQYALSIFSLSQSLESVHLNCARPWSGTIISVVARSYAKRVSLLRNAWLR